MGALRTAEPSRGEKSACAYRQVAQDCVQQREGPLWTQRLEMQLRKDFNTEVKGR